MAATPLAAPAAKKPTRAEITYANGMLDIRANDSSLNQILRAISRETGMTITGGVEDQRVFGNYGPAVPSSILATLLDGTNTNMLLREGDTTTHAELVLTPRTGGATPPNPNAAGFDDDRDDNRDDHVSGRRQDTAPLPAPPPAPTPAPSVPASNNPPMGPLSIPQPANNVLGNPANVTPTAAQIPTTDSVPLDAVPTPSTTQPVAQGIVDTPNPPAPGSTTGTDPNGPLTPQQVYQQLLQMQNKPAATTPAPAPQ